MPTALTFFDFALRFYNELDQLSSLLFLGYAKIYETDQLILQKLKFIWFALSNLAFLDEKPNGKFDAELCHRNSTTRNKTLHVFL